MATQPNNTISASIDFHIDPVILSKVEKSYKKKKISLSQAVKNFFEETYEQIEKNEMKEQDKHLMKYYGITSEQLHKEHEQLLHEIKTNPSKKGYRCVDELFKDCLEGEDED